MSRTLLVVPTAAGASLARTCLGLVRALDRRGVNVAFVKPVSQPRADGGPDRSIALATATTTLRPPDPLSTADLEQQLGSGGLDAVLEKIVAAWQPVHDRSDVVVVEGLSPGPAKLYAGGLNQALAKAVDADVLLVASWPTAGAASGEDRADGEAEPGPDPAGDAVKLLAESLAITASGYWSGEHTRVVGCVVNGTPAGDPSAAAQLRQVIKGRGGMLRAVIVIVLRPDVSAQDERGQTNNCGQSPSRRSANVRHVQPLRMLIRIIGGRRDRHPRDRRARTAVAIIRRVVARSALRCHCEE